MIDDARIIIRDNDPDNILDDSRITWAVFGCIDRKHTHPLFHVQAANEIDQRHDSGDSLMRNPARGLQILGFPVHGLGDTSGPAALLMATGIRGLGKSSM